MKWVPLGGIAKTLRGKRLVKNQLSQNGNFAVFQNSLTPLGYYHESNVKPDSVFIIGGGAAGEIGYNKLPLWAADDVYYFALPGEILDKFVYYWLLTQQSRIKAQVRKASVPRLSRTVVDNLNFPIPYPSNPEKSLAEQQRIVSILDKFDALTTSLTEGLPREIELRQKQYEYYRDLLLDFPRPEKDAA